MRKIKLTQNLFTMVDNVDFNYLNQFKWCAIKKRNKFYAVRGKWVKNKTKIFYMHRMILKTKKLIDHINGNSLDNRRKNLRKCNNKQNIRNSKLRKNKTGFKGVGKRNNLITNPYSANICVNYKNIHLGYFSNAIDAAKAYNNAAIKFFGKFANLNKV